MERMTDATCKVVCTMIGARLLGSTSWKMIVASFAPMALAAST